MGAFDHLEWTYDGAFEQLFGLGRGEFEQKFCKKYRPHVWYTRFSQSLSKTKEKEDITNLLLLCYYKG